MDNDLYLVYENRDKVKIYDIRNDNHGYPTFLIYCNNQWLWRSAKFFKPVITEEDKKSGSLHEDYNNGLLVADCDKRF